MDGGGDGGRDDGAEEQPQPQQQLLHDHDGDDNDGLDNHHYRHQLELLNQLEALDVALSADPANEDLLALRADLLAFFATTADAADADPPDPAATTTAAADPDPPDDRDPDGDERRDREASPRWPLDDHQHDTAAATATAAAFAPGDRCALPFPVGRRVLLLPALVVSTNPAAGTATVRPTTPVSARCRRPPGHTVPAALLLPFSAVHPAADDIDDDHDDKGASLFAVGAEVLARYDPDGLFYEARVVERRTAAVVVRYNDYPDHPPVPLPADAVFPLVDTGIRVPRDDDDGGGEDGDEEEVVDGAGGDVDASDSECDGAESGPGDADAAAEEEEDDVPASPRLFKYENGQELGAWDVTGVASRYLASMGYKGEGLGRRGNGIVRPIEAVILTPGRGLGFEPKTRSRSRRRRGAKRKREEPNGSGDEPGGRRGARKSSRAVDAAAAAAAAPRDLFAFLNAAVGGGADGDDDGDGGTHTRTETHAASKPAPPRASPFPARGRPTPPPPAPRHPTKPAAAAAAPATPTPAADRAALLRLSQKQSALRGEIARARAAVARNARARDAATAAAFARRIAALEGKLGEVEREEERVRRRVEGERVRKGMAAF
ncbi:hypothetical protein DFJ73DRAFT_962540 [Zopfochytrium polystomum]|nr:hypothetical protein DFJ73DRAFT_962540 [Zopfochytrium polystomum]